MHHRKQTYRKFFLKIFIVTAIVTALLLLVIGIYPIHGNGNFPMLKDGDLAITQKIGMYQIGDLVSYRLAGKRRFARIVGVEGDEINISAGGLQVNGMMPAEEVFYPTSDTSGKIRYPVTVGKNMVFVLNDFRDDEQDSRTFGTIEVSDLDGKIIFLFRRRKF